MTFLKIWNYSPYIYLFGRINGKILWQHAENLFVFITISLYKPICKQQDFNCTLIGQINFTNVACCDVINTCCKYIYSAVLALTGVIIFTRSICLRIKVQKEPANWFVYLTEVWLYKKEPEWNLENIELKNITSFGRCLHAYTTLVLSTECMLKRKTVSGIWSVGSLFSLV